MSRITYDFLVYLFKTKNIQSCDAETARDRGQLKQPGANIRERLGQHVVGADKPVTLGFSTKVDFQNVACSLEEGNRRFQKTSQS